jgi:hypothetical protein
MVAGQPSAAVCCCWKRKLLTLARKESIFPFSAAMGGDLFFLKPHTRFGERKQNSLFSSRYGETDGHATNVVRR